MTTPGAILRGGPRDGDVVPEYFSAAKVRFPRYRDDGRLVHDIYEARGAGFSTSPRPYVYTGEEIPPIPDPSCLAPTRRERRREYWARLGRAIRGRD